MLDMTWDIGYVLNKNWYEHFIEKVTVKLCPKCAKEILSIHINVEVILGNKDYDPPIELSRKWIDDENSIVDITKEEYQKTKSLT